MKFLKKKKYIYLELYPLLVLASLFISFLSATVVKKLTIIHLTFYLLLFMILVFPIFRKTSNLTISGYAYDLAFSISLIASILTGGISSPFLFPLLFLFYFITLQQKKVLTAIVGLISFGILILSSVISTKGFLSNYAYLFSGISFAVIAISIYLKPLSPENPDNYLIEKDFKEVTLDILDLEKKLLNVLGIDEIIYTYFKESPFCPPVCNLLVVYKPENKSFLYQYDIDSGEINSREVVLPFSLESKKIPSFIKEGLPEKFQLTAENDYFLIYHELKGIERVGSWILKLADIFLIESLSEARLLNYKQILLQELSETIDTTLYSEKTLNIAEVCEIAVLALKKLAFIEKAFFIPSTLEGDEKLLYEKKIVKGPLVRFPEEVWKTLLTELSNEALTTRELKIKATESLILFAVPVFDSGRLFGVLGGITSRANSIERQIKISEFIAKTLALRIRHEILTKELSKIEEAFSNFYLSFSNILDDLSLLTTKAIETKNFDGITQKLKEAAITLKEKIFSRLSLSETKAQLLLELFKSIKETNKFKEFNFHLNIDPEIVLTQSQLSFILRVLFECLLNTAVHSNAKTVNIYLKSENGNLRFEFFDDGKGFDLKQTIEQIKAGKIKATGLRNMAELAKKNNAKLRIRSGPNKGTKIEVVISHQDSK